MNHLSFSLLGSFRIHCNGRPLTDFRSAKVRALLAYLAVEADRPHQRTALAGLFWPEWPEAAALTYLRQAINNLQTLLGVKTTPNTILLATRHTLQFNPSHEVWLDVDHFCRQGALGATLSLASVNLQTIEQLQQAVALYQAPFLNGFVLDGCAEFEQWITLTRNRLQRLMLTMLQTVANHYERLGSYEQAQQYAWRAIEVEPTHEAAHQQMMRLLTYLGQRSSALLQFERCRTLLRQELAVEPSAETQILYQQICDNLLRKPIGIPSVAATTLPSLQPSLTKRIANVPSQATPLVGRQQEVRDLQAHLCNSECRLVTILGPGGMGKTRLAIAAAQALESTFLHGICYVSLVGVTEAALLPSALADALQLAFPDAADLSQHLLDYLGHKTMLLVFDNYEQLLPDAGFLQAVLAAAPGVKLLVTSRERLRLSQEWVFPLAGLTRPNEQALLSPGQVRPPVPIEEFDALTLFVKCAKRVRGDFAFGNDPAAVVRICQLVEGMPLAIELATGWLRIFSCRQIAENLTSSLDLLTTDLQDVAARHRSMKAVFAQSWRLLSDQEQWLLCWLAVFRGSFFYAAATAVTGAALSILLKLVDKSLLQANANGRFQLHELVRQFALEQLQADADEYTSAQSAYSTYYLRLLRQYIDSELHASDKAATERMAMEAVNVIAAWHWRLEQEEFDGIGQIAYDVHFYTNVCGHRHFYPLLEEAANALRRALQAANRRQDQGRLTTLLMAHARLLNTFGVMCYRLGYRQQAYEITHEAQSLLSTLPAGANSERGWIHLLMGWQAHFQGNQQAALSCGQRALQLFGEEVTAFENGSAHLVLGWASYMASDHARAEQYLTQIYEQFASPIFATHTYTLPPLAAIARARGDYQRAMALTQQCYTNQRAVNDVVGSTYSLCSLAHSYRAQGLLDQAVTYYQATLENAEEYGLRPAVETAQYGLGWVYYEKGELSQARHFFESNLQHAGEQNSPKSYSGVAATLKGLAAVATDQGQYVEATRHLHRALTIAQQSATLPLLLDILLQWATYSQRQGQIEQAVHLLQAVQQHPATKHATRANADQFLAEIAALSGEASAISKQSEQSIDLDMLVAGLLKDKR